MLFSFFACYSQLSSYMGVHKHFVVTEYLDKQLKYVFKNTRIKKTPQIYLHPYDKLSSPVNKQFTPKENNTTRRDANISQIKWRESLQISLC